MRKIVVSLAFLLVMSISTLSQAYIGAKAGLVDEDNFGYGLVFGVDLPLNLSLDASLYGFYQDNGPNTKDAWLQGDIDALYDLSGILSTFETLHLHPYVKGGFTYGALFLERPSTTDIEASHGPGINLGGGIDWKLGPVTVGLDITQSFVFLDGITVNNTQVSQDQTAKVFNVMAQVKLFAY
ncbi:MAG: hypothetical protein R3A11_01475 [Bdellovibrionota bacterium]